MKRTVRSLPRSYDKLLKLHNPRPIRTAADYKKAADVLEMFVGFDRLTKDQEDYMEMLALLVEEYEKRNHDIATSHLTGLDMLRFLVAEHGMSASDLGRLLGNRSLGSKLLSGQRGLSKANISKLAEHFAVSPAVFLEAPERPARRAG